MLGSTSSPSKLSEANSLAQPTLRLFRGFREDRRTSMDVYADSLEKALRRVNPKTFDISTFIPKALPGASDQGGLPSLKMRFSRYLGYPWQSRRVNTIGTAQ